MITNEKDIAYHYLKGWFLIDIFANFPFEAFINTEKSSRSSLKLLKWFKLPKLLRVARYVSLTYIRMRMHKHSKYRLFSKLFFNLLGS